MVDHGLNRTVRAERERSLSLFEFTADLGEPGNELENKNSTKFYYVLNVNNITADINPEENGEEEEEEEERASDFDLEEMEENQEESGPVKNHSQGTKRKQAEVVRKNLLSAIVLQPLQGDIGYIYVDMNVCCKGLFFILIYIKSNVVSTPLWLILQ